MGPQVHAKGVLWAIQKSAERKDRAKEKEIIDKKAEIISLLSDEILKRYFYREGMYNYQVANNLEIQKAIEVLNDTKKYHRILK